MLGDNDQFQLAILQNLHSIRLGTWCVCWTLIGLPFVIVILALLGV